MRTRLVKSLVWGALLTLAPLTARAVITIDSTGSANSVTLGWKPSPDSTVAGYFLGYGLVSGQCTNLMDVRNVTNTTLSGLELDTPYYFAVIAYDATGHRSVPSNEVQYTVPTPPTLETISDKTINEGELLTFPVAASDPNAPTNQLSFALGTGAPAGASITPDGGVFTWTPGESDGPGTFSISAIVTDMAAPSISATQTFLVVVNEVNSAPRLTPPPDQVVYAGLPISLNATATDSDWPENQLSFSLAGSALTAAQINHTNGQFSWTPDATDAGTTNTVTVTVTDNGLPPLSDSGNFTIAVLPPPIIGSVAESNGTVTIRWPAIVGRSYRLQFKPSLDGSNWTDLPGDITATAATASKSDAPDRGTRWYRIEALP